MEWNGMEWIGMEWNGMEWNGIVILQPLHFTAGIKKHCTSAHVTILVIVRMLAV
jgi:hypothetical protein